MSIKHFHRRLNAKPNSYLSLANLGKVYELMKVADSAYYYHQLTAQLDPLDYSIRYELAEKAMQLGNFDQALQYSLQAEQLAPNMAIVQTQLAIIYSQLGDPKALKYFHNAYKLESDSCGYAINLGIYFNNTNSHDSAVYYLDQGLAKPCESSIKFFGLKFKFDSLVKLKQYEQAREVLEYMSTLHPNSPEINQLRKRLEMTG